MSISVCIPTYNQGRYLAQCINSVLGQSLLPDEIIVSNDCSTDDTRTVLEELTQAHPRLRVIHQPHNLGMVANTNHCLREARTDIVVKLDSDDCLLPTYVEQLAGLLRQHPGAGYAHAAVREMDTNGHAGKVRRLFRASGMQPAEAALRAASSGYRVAANIIMFRKAALEAAGYITSNVKFGEDFYLSVEMADAGYGNVYADQVLSCYRVWNDDQNVRQRRKLNEINGIRLIFERLQAAFERRGWHGAQLAAKRRQFACAQADCLTWDIYSEPEKNELEAALRQLSSAAQVKAHILLYRNGFGKALTAVANLRGWLAQVIKRVLAGQVAPQG